MSQWLFDLGSKCDMDIREAYDKLFEEYLKLKEKNRSTLKKLNNLKLEDESLVAKLEESTRSLNE